MFSSYLEPSWTHMRLCKLQTSLEMGKFGTDSAQGGPWGMQLEG